MGGTGKSHQGSSLVLASWLKTKVYFLLEKQAHCGSAGGLCFLLFSSGTQADGASAVSALGG